MPISRNTKLAIVPAYNEASCLGRVLRELRQHAPDFDVLVIDDGSTDATAGVARAAGVHVIRHPFNLGIGGAVQSGFQFAQDNGYAIAVQIDGDGQHDPAQISLLLERLRTEPAVDMVIGSRFLSRDGAGYRSSASRRVGIRLFAFLLSRIVRQPVTDPTSGFRASGRRAIELFARDYPHDYPEVEAVLMSHSHRLRSAEVPVVMRPRAGGESSIRTHLSALYMLKVMLAVLVGLFRARPVVEAGDSAPVTAEHSL